MSFETDMLGHAKTVKGGRNTAQLKNGKLNINHETEQQINELKKKVDDKEFEKMTKNLNRFCGNFDACAPLLFGALQVLVKLHHIKKRF